MIPIASKNQLVKIELASILVFHLALIFVALLALMIFTVIGNGVFGNETGDPLQDKIFTPMGILLCAAVLGLPAGFLLSVSLALHRYVVVPRVAELVSEDDGSDSGERAAAGGEETKLPP